MKNYKKPELKIMELSIVDVIQTSETEPETVQESTEIPNWGGNNSGVKFFSNN